MSLILCKNLKLIFFYKASSEKVLYKNNFVPMNVSLYVDVSENHQWIDSYFLVIVFCIQYSETFSLVLLLYRFEQKK
jgi:hypothetical protein